MTECKGCGIEGHVFRKHPRPRLYSDGVTTSITIDQKGNEIRTRYGGWFCRKCLKKFKIIKKEIIADLVKQRIELMLRKAEKSDEFIGDWLRRSK